jgi:hypothetical protein
LNVLDIGIWTTHTEITWFVIGAMIMSGLIYFGQGQLLNACTLLAIAGANYWLLNRK